MTEQLAICLSPLCAEEKNLFFFCPSQRPQHKHHPASHVHPFTFVPLFHDQELFADQEMQAVSLELEQSYQQLREFICKALTELLELHRTASVDFLRVFKNQNEVEFTKRLEKAAGGENLEYLEVALEALTGQAAGIKDKIRSILQRRVQQLREKVWKAVLLISPSDDAGERRERQELENSPELQQQGNYNGRGQQIQLSSKMEEESTSTLRREERQRHEENQNENQHSRQQILSNEAQFDPTDGPCRIDESSEIDLHESNLHESKGSAGTCANARKGNEAVPKQRRIRKGARRGRPCKNGTEMNVCVGRTYQDIFMQCDMDCFFPKALPTDFLFAVSDFAKSPWFKIKKNPNIIICSEQDLKMVTGEPRLVEEVEELSVSQKNAYVRDENLQLNLVFELVQRPNQLKYFHLRDVFLQASHMQSLQLLLERNADSLETLMLEECQLVTCEITELISTMHSLKKLKLHSGYNRRFHLCFEHLLNLHGLVALSLSSAVFVDVYGEEVGEGYTFSDIYRLRRLQQLTLYNCYPVFTETLALLHPDLHSSLTHLNLGITDVTAEAVPELRKFRNLSQLSVDETQLQGRDLIRIFEGRANNQLKELSLWRLNDERWKEEKRGFQNGHVSREELTRLAHLLPELSYINIAHCKSLRGFNLLKFPSLTHACVSTDMYSQKELARLKRRISVFVEEFIEEKSSKTLLPHNFIEIQ